MPWGWAAGLTLGSAPVECLHGREPLPGKKTMKPITEAHFGQTVTILKVSGDLRTRRHLADLGCVINAKVTIVNEQDGDLILKVRGARVAIGASMAREIYI